MPSKQILCQSCFFHFFHSFVEKAFFEQRLRPVTRVVQVKPKCDARHMIEPESCFAFQGPSLSKQTSEV